MLKDLIKISDILEYQNIGVKILEYRNIGKK